jgi:hypothetical protein
VMSPVDRIGNRGQTNDAAAGVTSRWVNPVERGVDRCSGSVSDAQGERLSCGRVGYSITGGGQRPLPAWGNREGGRR